MNEKELYLVVGAAGAAVIAYAGYRFRALTRSGAWAAFVLGGITFSMGGYVAAAALLFFFISGSLLSRLSNPYGHKEKIARNWKQVLCNGGPAAAAVALVYFVPSYRESGTLFFLGALATATADTWATEIGLRSRARVLHVLTFRPVARGLSGGISLPGVLASLIGALVFSLVPFILLPGDDFLCGLFLVSVVPIAASAGVIGALLDSVIGATLQAKYRRDGTVLESAGEGAELIAGIPIVTNDVTNLIATAWGGLVAVGLTTF